MHPEPTRRLGRRRRSARPLHWAPPHSRPIMGRMALRPRTGPSGSLAAAMTTTAGQRAARRGCVIVFGRHERGPNSKHGPQQQEGDGENGQALAATIPTPNGHVAARQMWAPSGSAHISLAPDLANNRPQSGLASQEDGDESEMDLVKSMSRAYLWHWSELDKSDECIVSEDKLEVCFHPECSESAAAIRGSEPLVKDGNYYYWEVKVFEKTYGTSMMFGVCTKGQQLHLNEYRNLIGLDGNGWSLSHKGLIWHRGKYAQYTDLFPPNQPITIGLLYNSNLGELSYFMNGKNLGVAFCGLNHTTEDLYPVIGSTAKCTKMRLVGAYRGYISLLERTCFTLIKNTDDIMELIENFRNHYQLPRDLIIYLTQAAQIYGNQNAIDLCKHRTKKIRLR